MKRLLPVIAIVVLGALGMPSFPARAAVGAPKVGYLGCSVTAADVDGYHDVGGKKFWSQYLDYDGGTVQQWATPGGVNAQLWSAFGSELNKKYTTVFFWMLCKRDDESGDMYLKARAVLDKLKATVPGATVYVSGMPSYLPPGLCAKASANQPAEMRALAARLVAEGRAKQGPELAALTPVTEEAPAFCSPNDIGKQIHGRQLLNFFG